MQTQWLIKYLSWNTFFTQSSHLGTMLSSHIFSLKNNATASHSTLKYVFCVGMSVFVLVCVVPPTANLPNSILTPQAASWRKTQHTASMEASKQTGSEIAHCTQSKKPLHPSNKLYDQRHNKTQINKLINLQCNLATLRDHRVWGGVGRRNNCLQYFEFRLQYPFQLLAVLKSHKNGIPSQTILILYKTHKYLKFMSWLGQNLINMISCLVWMHKIRG